MDVLQLASTAFHWYWDNASLFFATCIIVALVGEKLWQWLQRKDLQLRSGLTSMVSGAGFLIAKTLMEKALFFGLSWYIYDNYRLFDLPLSNPAVWIGVFIGRDFVYYWVHRSEHKIQLLWASHLVHHSPETIGMATAVRVPWMEALYKPWFSLWMPLLGFHPLAKIVFDVFASTLAQVQHTEAFPARPDGQPSLIGRVFVTPSAHRVHHGYNPEYLDKNFGAVFIIWDRMFGTYKPEVAKVRYGVGERDAVVTGRDALVGGYGRLFTNMWRAGSPHRALAIALRPPGAQ